MHTLAIRFMIIINDFIFSIAGTIKTSMQGQKGVEHKFPCLQKKNPFALTKLLNIILRCPNLGETYGIETRTSLKPISTT